MIRTFHERSIWRSAEKSIGGGRRKEYWEKCREKEREECWEECFAYLDVWMTKMMVLWKTREVAANKTPEGYLLDCVDGRKLGWVGGFIDAAGAKDDCTLD